MAEKQLTEGQGEFLRMAERKGVPKDHFGQFIPEIQFQEDEPDSSKPTIAYLHTGGTLMMVPSKKADGALSFDGALDIGRVIEVCQTVGMIRDRYNIVGVDLASVDSKEIRPDLWTSMAATIKSMYEDIDGVVIGHGTHTAEYSAAGLGYALQRLAKPVVITASQIPIMGEPGSDGYQNLTGAMQIAAHGDLAEVVGFAGGTVFRGTRMTKANDDRLGIFESKVVGPVAHFGGSGVEVLAGARRRSGKRDHELMYLPNFNPHVTALKVNPGMNADIIDAIVSAKKDVGLVIETYGSGALPRDMVDVLSKHVKDGYPIFVSSSCGESGISMGMQLHDEDAIAAYEAGIRNVGDMSTTAAVTKLMHVMGTMPDASLADVEHEMIRKNYAGEISLRSQIVEDY